MRPADLLGRTSVRLALAFALLLIAAFAVAGAVAWGLIRQDLEAQADRRILQTWRTIATEAVDGPEELAAAVEEQLAAVADLSTVILLTDSSGAPLAGNLQAFQGTAGWSNRSAMDLGLPEGSSFRLYAGPVSEGFLVVGSTDADLHEIGAIVLGALGWASVAVLIVAFGGGALIAAGVQARMERMESVLDRVGEGDLTARMAVRGSGDLARLAQGINSALVRLERVVEGMRQVSTDIAHDLRTPLGRLRFRIEAAAARAPEGSRLAEDLDAALEESDTLDATFAALLRIAEIEAGARRARFAPLDLGEVLVRIVEAYEGVAEEAGQNLSLSLSVTAPIHGDRDLLVQLFANLVENAIRHGPAGTRIECTVTQEGDCPQATLRDTGPGIPAAERELVLRRLYRLEKSRTSPGTGLGLALVKAVADLHAADLILADAGPGLRVTLRFPPFRASA